MSDHTNAESGGQNLAGVVGFFKDASSLTEATKKIRNANYESFDTFTPYPVHGLESAQGLKRSPLPYITFTFGLAGLACAFLLQYWTSAISWPIIVGGKPFNSWPAFVPVMFELTILFAGIATVFGMFALNRLPNTAKKSFDSGITRDRFAIMVDNSNNEPACKKFEVSEVESFLSSVGASDIRKVYSEGWF